MTSSSRVLIIDDDAEIRNSVSKLVRVQGYSVQCARDAQEGLDAIESDQIDVALVDMHMPSMEGLEVLQGARRTAPNTVCIVVTGDGDVDLANRALELGAFDYLEKPIESLAQFGQKLRRAAEVARLRVQADPMQHDDAADRMLIGNSEGMEEVRRQVRKLAGAHHTLNVMIRGESGTGKEVVARALHKVSGRTGRFVGVNCGAFAQGLEEKDLFGNKKGAFTGATEDYEGMFGAAAGGTILLDEIGEMPPPLQVKLLRAVQERVYTPVGSTEEVELTAQILTATHRDLSAEVDAKRFRHDLHYRLDIGRIWLPPLRERREDIRPLALRFIHGFNQLDQGKVKYISPEAMAELEKHDWPGNVRQLQSEIRRAVLIAPGDTLTADLLFEESRPKDPALSSSLGMESLLTLPWAEAREQVLANFARVYLPHHLTHADYVIADAARSAGMKRPNFRRLMDRYDIPGRDD